jgi:hypothetical protein
MKIELRYASVAVLTALLAVVFVQPADALMCYDCISAFTLGDNCATASNTTTAKPCSGTDVCELYTAYGSLIRRCGSGTKDGCTLGFCTSSCKTDYCNNKNGATSATAAPLMAYVLTAVIGLIGATRLG